MRRMRRMRFVQLHAPHAAASAAPICKRRAHPQLPRHPRIRARSAPDPHQRLTPHPLHVMLNYTHPPMLARISAIREDAARGKASGKAARDQTAAMV
jgi:hypothetical protein